MERGFYRFVACTSNFAAPALARPLLLHLPPQLLRQYRDSTESSSSRGGGCGGGGGGGGGGGWRWVAAVVVVMVLEAALSKVFVQFAVVAEEVVYQCWRRRGTRKLAESEVCQWPVPTQHPQSKNHVAGTVPLSLGLTSRCC